METNNLADIWEAFLEYIEKNIKNPGFSKWIKPAIPLAITDEIFEIGVDKKFIKDWIDAKLRSEMEGILFELTGKSLSLKVTNLADEQSPSFQPDSVTITNNKPLSVISNSQQQNIAQVEDIVSNLNSKYVFETFVIGNSNRFAHAAALAVAEAPAKVYNPLFLYGDVGLGKTHLMHAIGNRIKKNNPKMKVLYISSEMFTNEMIFSIQKNTMDAFRNKYRNIDCLLIDDIQFLRKKESTQEEFFHTFNHLHMAGKQIIISSDKPPKDIETLEARLRTRFEWGLIADIQSPNYETRMAILQKKIELDGLEKYHIPTDVIEYIAQNVKSNIRELEGSLNKLIAFAILGKKEIDIPLAAEALKDIVSPNENRPITASLIIDVVAEHFNVSIGDLKSSKRNAEIVTARQIAMYLCRQMTEIPLKSVGIMLGGRDHSTVSHGVDKVAADIVKSETLNNTVEIVKKKINPA